MADKLQLFRNYEKDKYFKHPRGEEIRYEIDERVRILGAKIGNFGRVVAVTDLAFPLICMEFNRTVLDLRDVEELIKALQTWVEDNKSEM